MKSKEKNGIYIFAFCALPLIIMGVLSFWKGFDLSEFMLTNNDEVSWYNQVAAVVKYGKPLGYYGYNGSYAKIGTFGPWGMSVILFMSIIPKLLSFFTGMNESLLIIGNLAWACLANGLFVLLAKPSRGQLKALILLYLCLSMPPCLFPSQPLCPLYRPHNQTGTKDWAGEERPWPGIQIKIKDHQPSLAFQ